MRSTSALNGSALKNVRDVPILLARDLQRRDHGCRPDNKKSGDDNIIPRPRCDGTQLESLLSDGSILHVSRDFDTIAELISRECFFAFDIEHVLIGFGGPFRKASGLECTLLGKG
jgi:hypothetical protein